MAKIPSDKRILMELTIFDLSADSSGVHVYIPPDLTESEYITNITTLTKVLNSLAEQRLSDLQPNSNKAHLS